MYLARLADKDRGSRFIIRQSYAHGRCYRSRNLFDLGNDPSRFIVYPGGNGFYIDPAVEDAITEQGVAVSQFDLEPIFMPFLPRHIRRVIDGFTRKTRADRPSQHCVPADCLHRFDRYRLHFLKLGRVDSRDLGAAPERFYASLQHKSRDEIEYDFIAAERILRTQELAHYTYQIFDLQRHFSEGFARSHPEALDQERMDRLFVDHLCQLNRDDQFWAGSDACAGLQHHLERYAIIYFDSCFPLRDPLGGFAQDFMNRHRRHRPPETVRVSLAQSARLLGVTVDRLKTMDRCALTRQYRKRALQHHPDRGGDPENFVKLSAAYRQLLMGMARR